MTTDNQHIREALSAIYRMAEASEKGYATAAANLTNPGLKVLFRYFAQQRAAHTTEILAELRALGGNIRPGRSIPGMIHRGRVNIFAAMTIEKDQQEKVILQEALLGETYALRAYRRALAAPLAPPLRAKIQRQLDEVRKANDQVELLRGKEGRRDVIQLLDPAAPKGLADLTGVVQKITLSQTDLYRGRGATIPETVLSGAFGGALWGGLTGLLVGFGVLQTTSPAPVGLVAVLGVWALVAFGFLLLGAFVAAALSVFIGISVSEDDTVLQMLQNGEAYHLLLQTVEEAPRRGEKSRPLAGRST